MSPAPLSTRFSAAMFSLAGAIGDRRHLLPSWAIACATGMLARLQRRVMAILRAIESGTYRTPKPRPARAPAHRPASITRPAVPALQRFPRIRGMLSEMTIYAGGMPPAPAPPAPPATGTCSTTPPCRRMPAPSPLWRGSPLSPDCLPATMRPLLSKPVLRILAREFRFLDRMGVA